MTILHEDIRVALPSPPDGYELVNGFYVPADQTPVSKSSDQNLLVGNEIAAHAPKDIRYDNSGSSEYEKLYLWRDPVAALNRLINTNELDSLRETFGDLHQYNELGPILDVLNEQCTLEQLEQINKDFNALLEQLHDRAPDETLTGDTVWDYVGLMADYISVQSDMKDIALTEPALDLMLRGLNGLELPEKLLDFISHFDVSKELAGRLLDRIDCHPNHPLYWWIASRCPDHPEVISQRNAVASVREGDLAAIASLDPQKLLPLGLLVQEQDFFPRTGIELETTAFVDAVKVPQGTMMGTDEAYRGETVLELRLDHAADINVLNYDEKWLERYFKIWRWEKVARGISSSVHIHSEGIDEIKSAFSRVHFGIDRDSCRNNELGTIEVRTALKGYIDQHLQGSGYQELPHPSFIELMHQCAQPESILFQMSMIRLGHTNWRTRVADFDTFLNDLNIQLDRGDPTLDSAGLYGLLAPILTDSMKDALFKHAITDETEYSLANLLDRYSSLSPAQQDLLIDMVLSGEYSPLLTHIFWQYDRLAPDQRTKVFEMAISNKDIYIQLNIVAKIGLLSPDQQTKVFEMALAHEDHRTDRVIAEQISYLSSDQQEIIIDMGYKIYSIAEGLVRSFDRLTPEQQTKVFDLVIAHNEIHLLRSLLFSYTLLTVDQRDKLFDIAIAYYDLSVLEPLAENYSWLTPDQQAVISDMIAKENDNHLLWLIFKRLKLLTVDQRENLFDIAITCGGDSMLELVVDNFSLLTPDQQIALLHISNKSHFPEITYNAGRSALRMCATD